ncbi:MAG: hypothetical protein FWD57_00340 [Polyangiaceae bacterium]|nr:hypothetical protein [Polyangiaceae bacterium]
MAQIPRSPMYKPRTNGTPAYPRLSGARLAIGLSAGVAVSCASNPMPEPAGPVYDPSPRGEAPMPYDYEPANSGNADDADDPPREPQAPETEMNL